MSEWRNKALKRRPAPLLPPAEPLPPSAEARRCSGTSPSAPLVFVGTASAPVRGGVGACGGGPRGDAGRPACVVSGAVVRGGVALRGGVCSGEDCRTRNTRDIGTWSSSSESRIARRRLRVTSSAPMFKAPPVHRRLPCPSRWEAPSSRGRFPAALLLLRVVARSGPSSSSSLSPNRSALPFASARRRAERPWLSTPAARRHQVRPRRTPLLGAVHRP